MKRILVPVDGSNGARHAATFAGNLARDGGATVELVYIYDAPTAAMMGLRAVEDIEKLKAEVAGGSVAAARAAIGDGVEIVEHVAIGHPGDEIVAHSKKNGHDLICMGSRGRTEVAELMLGSVSQYVLHHAVCPVLVVR